MTTDQTHPTNERHRYETVRRRPLTVAATTRLTPNMIRVTLTGEELSDFTSLAPDDHIKLVVETGPDQIEMRDYTPRRYSNEARELIVDFAVHEAGPATAWALNAKVGDTITVAGPRGSQRVLGPTDWLLVGDETALPAIARRIEEAPAGHKITALIAVPGPEDEQRFETQADLHVTWIHRPATQAADPAPMLAALQAAAPGPSQFVWIAAEAGVTKSLRGWLLDTHGHSMIWLKAKGYWTKGLGNTTENF